MTEGGWIFCAHQVPDPTATMVQLMYGSTRSSSLACKFMQVAGGYWLLTAPPNTHCSNHAAPPIAERNNTGMHTQTRLKGLAVQPDLTETSWSPRIGCHWASRRSDLTYYPPLGCRYCIVPEGGRQSTRRELTVVAGSHWGPVGAIPGKTAAIVGAFSPGWG